jgi:hypothetical protein
MTFPLRGSMALYSDMHNEPGELGLCALGYFLGLAELKSILSTRFDNIIRLSLA